MAAYVYGFVNVRFYAESNPRPTYYGSIAARDKAMAALRAEAVAAGLSVAGAKAGIYPVESTLRDARLEWHKGRAAFDRASMDVLYSQLIPGFLGM